jgi:hypothetical protein
MSQPITAQDIRLYSLPEDATEAQNFVVSMIQGPQEMWVMGPAETWRWLTPWLESRSGFRVRMLLSGDADTASLGHLVERGAADVTLMQDPSGLAALVSRTGLVYLASPEAGMAVSLTEPALASRLISVYHEAAQAAWDAGGSQVMDAPPAGVTPSEKAEVRPMALAPDGSVLPPTTPETSPAFSTPAPTTTSPYQPGLSPSGSILDAIDTTTATHFANPTPAAAEPVVETPPATSVPLETTMGAAGETATAPPPGEAPPEGAG